MDRRILYVLFWTVLAHALTRGAQVVRELAIASKFGVSAEADMIVLLLFVPTFIHQYFIANFPQAGIPLYLDEEVNRGVGAARRFHGGVIKCFSIFLMAAGLAVPAVSMISDAKWFPFSETAFFKRATPNDLLILGGVIVFRGLFTLFSLGLLARKEFAKPALINCITPLLVSAALFLSPQAVGVSAALKLFFIGHAVELLLILIALSDERIRPDFRGAGNSHVVKTSFSLHLPLILGSSLMGFTAFIERWRVAGLGQGDIAAFQYASLIVTLPTIVLALPLSQISLTYFSRLQSEGLSGRLSKMVMAFALLAGIAGTVMGLSFSQIAYFLTSHIYGFGVFKGSDHQVISDLVAPFALQIPFYLVGVVLAQVLSVLRKNTWITVGSGLNLIFHFVLSGVLVHRAGAQGVALATSLTYLFSAVILAVFVRKHLSRNSVGPRHLY